jgi:hypothetical protein
VALVMVLHVLIGLGSRLGALSECVLHGIVQHA